MSGFFIFKEEKRADLEKANPGAKLTQIVKIASEHW